MNWVRTFIHNIDNGFANVGDGMQRGVVSDGAWFDPVLPTWTSAEHAVFHLRVWQSDCVAARHRTSLRNINCAPSADAAERIELLVVHMRNGFKNTGPRTMRSLPLTFNRYNVMPCIFKTISCDATQLHGTSLCFPMSYHAMSLSRHASSLRVQSSPDRSRHAKSTQLKPNGPVSWQTHLVAPPCALRHLAHLLSLSLVLPSS